MKLPAARSAALPVGRRSVLSLLLGLGTAGCVSAPSHPQRVPLVGALNFRDFGGYATHSGQRVREETLYRSDHLADLDDFDMARLNQLGLKRLYDLRGDREKAAKPDRLPHQNGGQQRQLRARSDEGTAQADVAGLLEIRVVEVPVYYPPLDRAETRRKILRADVNDGDFYRLMVAANRAFALNYNNQWAALLRGLTEPDAAPVLIHCADGKDRTGFAAAILLRILGVPQETVMEDYLLSNQLLEDKIDVMAFLASLGSLFRVSKSAIKPILGVNRAYLQAAFAAIDEHYGSFDTYLTEGLRIDTNTVGQLREKLLV